MSLNAVCHQLGCSILNREYSESDRRFPFSWADLCWKHTMEYFVQDFEAEIGFFVGILGFAINTISNEYIMLTPPSREFFFSFSRANASRPETPPNSIKCCFMIDGVHRTQVELSAKGVQFETEPTPAGGGLYKARFRSPHGVEIELWGTLDARH